MVKAKEISKVKLSKLKLNPKNPRFIRDDKFDKLKKSINDFPEMMEARPIIIDEAGIILGGNMRYRALNELGHKDVPESWVKMISGLTEAQKDEFVIKDNVGFGEWDWDDLANEWKEEDLEKWALDLPLFDTKKDPPDADGYTQKIESPIYEPTGEKPELKDLYDLERHNELIADINKSKLSQDHKEFLKICAYRHIVFNYDKIAEYYAHSKAEMQDLMEQSALVIIDFKKAIEMGYVQLGEEIKEQFVEESNNE